MNDRTRVVIRDGRIVRLKTCLDCGMEGVCDAEPNTDFRVNRKRPDGSPLWWSARCKPCQRKHEVAVRHPNREVVNAQARERRRRNRIERQREGAQPEVPVEPFWKWVRAYMAARGFTTAGEVANDLGLIPRRMQDYMELRQPMMSMDVVDTALIRASTEVEVDGVTIFTISDLYGDWLDRRKAA